MKANFSPEQVQFIIRCKAKRMNYHQIAAFFPHLTTAQIKQKIDRMQNEGKFDDNEENTGIYGVTFSPITQAVYLLKAIEDNGAYRVGNKRVSIAQLLNMVKEL